MTDSEQELSVTFACELLAQTRSQSLSIDARIQTVRDFLDVIDAENFPKETRHVLFGALVQMGIMVDGMKLMTEQDQTRLQEELQRLPSKSLLDIARNHSAVGRQLAIRILIQRSCRDSYHRSQVALLARLLL